MVDSFMVQPAAFINNEFPANGNLTVQNGTREQTNHIKEASTGLLAVYITIMVIALVLIFFFTVLACKGEKKDDNLVGHTLLEDNDNTPADTSGSVKAVNVSEEPSMHSMRDKNTF